mgnify:CR=1 FL=1
MALKVIRGVLDLMYKDLEEGRKPPIESLQLVEMTYDFLMTKEYVLEKIDLEGFENKKSIFLEDFLKSIERDLNYLETYPEIEGSRKTLDKIFDHGMDYSDKWIMYNRLFGEV